MDWKNESLNFREVDNLVQSDSLVISKPVLFNTQGKQTGDHYATSVLVDVTHTKSDVKTVTFRKLQAINIVSFCNHLETSPLEHPRRQLHVLCKVRK